MKTSEVSAEVKKQPDETREKAQVNELLRSIQGETAPGKSGEIPAATDDLLRARLELRPEMKQEAPEGPEAADNLLEEFSARLEQEKKEAERFSEEVQVNRLAEYLQGMDDIKLEKWKDLSLEERREVLQKIENMAAEIGGRPALEVVVTQLPAGTRGAMDWGSKQINMNEALVSSDTPEDLRQAVKTLVHEGRHAYQFSNVFESRREPNSEKFEAWCVNLETMGYLSASEYGFQLYYTQPVEVDARVYSESVVSRIKI